MKLVDMELDDEDQIDRAYPGLPEKPRFPYGLKICLEPTEIKKLELDTDVRVGHLIDLRAFAIVTNVDISGRVELQIQKLAVENEMDEGEDG